MALRESDVLQGNVYQFPSIGETAKQYENRIKSQEMVLEVYKSWLSIHARNSDNTVREYEKKVTEFFKMTLGKEIGHIALKEIKAIKKSHVQTEYIDRLIERGNSNNTIQNKLNIVRSFYNELMSNDLHVNPTIFKVKLEKDVEHHESLSFEELQQLFEFMKNEKEKPMEKYLLVKTLFTTANRKTATMGIKVEQGMTWEDNFIVRKDVNTGQSIHVVRVQDKGKKWHEKPISDEFYNELQQINKGQKYVFELCSKTLQRALERFSKQLGRKITPHGLKATAITLSYQMCKDINLCKALGGHSSIVTTQIYLRDEKSLVNQLSYTNSKEYDESVIESLTSEDWLEFMNQNEDIKRMVVMRLGK